MRIAHITDLHYSKAKGTYDYDTLFEALMESLLEEHKEVRIDLVFITGDLLDKGGLSFGTDDGYRLLEEKILNKIARELNLDKSRIAIIPGNHDVKQGDAIYLNNLEGIRSLPEVVRINNKIEPYYTELRYPEDEKHPEKVFPGLEPYKKFEKLYYRDFPKDTKKEAKKITSFESCFVYNFNGAKIGVAAFNSAWSCHTELDKEPDEDMASASRIWQNIAFGTEQIQRAAKFFKEENTDFNIALVHHPLGLNFYSVSEEKEIKEELSRHRFFMLFCGHTHKAKDSYVLEPNSSYYLIVTKSTFNDPRIKIEEYKSGFSLVDITYSTDKHIEITRHFRKYFHTPRKFSFDQEEAFNGKNCNELRTDNIGKKFVEYLKKENPLYDPGRKVLFERINSATQQYLKSQHAEVTDLALKKVLEKLLPSDTRSFHIRKECRLNITVSYESEDYYNLTEFKSFKIVSDVQDTITFTTFNYVHTDIKEEDKSTITIKKFVIDSEDYKDRHICNEEVVRENNVNLLKTTWEFKKDLTGKKEYYIEREITALNSLKLNKAWKIEMLNIVYGYDLIITNPDNKYAIEVFNIGNGKDYSNLGVDGKLIDKPIHIHEPEGILTPGDIILIVVNLF